MGSFSNFIQIMVFVLIIAGPVIGSIAKKAKTHTEQKRLEAERDRRRTEALRRGQPIAEMSVDRAGAGAGAGGGSAEATRRAKLEELQRRRQAQIEELRRRHREAQAQAQARTAGQQARQPQIKTMASSRPQMSAPRQPVRAMPHHPTQVRGAADAARQVELEHRRAELRARREQHERAQAQAKARAKAKAKSKPARNLKQKARPKAPAKIAARGHARTPIEAASLASAMHDPASIRRAIVMNEILSPPLSLRGQPGMSD